MFWNKVARLYDLFEITYNKKVYKGTGIKVADFINAEDEVLECACGTGAISVSIAPNCRKLIATDYSEGMLKQTKKKLASYNNVKVEPADITALHYADNSFNKVVAGNVIHLLPNPKSALDELFRVCKSGGKLIIPTYIYTSQDSNKFGIGFIQLLGFKHNRKFTEESYKEFFSSYGIDNAQYYIVNGRMPCDIAVISVEK